MSEAPVDIDPNVGYSFIDNAFDESYLYEVNRNTFVKQSAAEVMSRHFGSFFSAADTLYIIIGSDSGLLIHHLLRSTQKQGSRFLLIEPDALYPIISTNISIPAERDDIILAPHSQLGEQFKRVNLQTYFYLDQVKQVQSIGAFDAYLDEYRKIHSEVKEQLANIGLHTRAHRQNTVFSNCWFTNIAANINPAALLRKSAKSGTAIILAGGPSLDMVLPWVINNREKLFVIAVSRIGKRLLDAGLVPDIVVAIDPQPMLYSISRESLLFSPAPLLVYAYHVNSRLLYQWPGETLFLGPRYPWEPTNDSKNIPVVPTTVSHTATNLAIEMGFSTILLAGLDLCFSQDGFTHAENSIERSSQYLPSGYDAQVDTYAGKPAGTTRPMLLGVMTFKSIASFAKHRGCQLININPNAAKLEGVEYQPHETIELDTIEMAFNIQTKPNDWARHYRESTQQLNRANHQASKVIKLSQDALEYNHKLHGTQGKPGDYRYKKKMDRVEKLLNKEYKDIFNLCRSRAAGHLLRLNKPSGLDNLSNEELSQWAHEYYSIIMDSAFGVQQQIQLSQKIISTRLKEEQAEPNMTELIKDWSAERIIGRSRLWEITHSSARLDNTQRQQLHDCYNKFLNEINSINRSSITQEERISQQRASSRSTILRLFERGAAGQLDNYAEQVGSDNSYGKDLYILAKGMAHELRGNNIEALDQYAAMIDTAAELINSNQRDAALDNPILEDILKRLVQITFNEGMINESISVLSILNDISPLYSRHYAKALAISGQIEEALQVLDKHIKDFPKDSESLIQLGEIYQSAGIPEAAKIAFELALKIAPGNPYCQQRLATLD